MIFVILLVLSALLVLFFMKVNLVYRKSSHWKSKFFFQKNFIHLSKPNSVDVINLGSNPALYGFFYENVKGQNLSTGSQGLPMDFEILKCYHSNLNKGGIVLIPIMPFTSISQYLRAKPEYCSDEYYMKFISILNIDQAEQLPHYKKLMGKLKFPLLFRPKDVLHICFNSDKPSTLSITEQEMSALELEQDAQKWIQGWMKEFDVRSMEDFYSDKFQQYYEEGAKILNDMIDYCLMRELKPVLITLPMSPSLDNMFNDEFRQRMIIDFVTRANKRNIPFLDYWNKHLFYDSSFYMNSFFFNLTGRKKFTNQVIQDLKSQKILN